MKEESNLCHNNKEEEAIENSDHPENTRSEQEKQIMEPVPGEPGNE